MSSKCPRCHGSGTEITLDVIAMNCPRCYGHGKVECPRCSGSGDV
jgi:DnaJ-class molecular chaperone